MRRSHEIHVEQSPYVLRLEMPGLPIMNSASSKRSRWDKAKSRRFWQRELAAVIGRKKPGAPLGKASVRMVRHSNVAPDYDNLVESFKPVMDALRDCRIIVDDSMKVIGKPEYDWQQAPPRKNFITIEVRQEQE